MKHKLHSWLDAFRWRKLLLIWAVFLAMAAILFAERSGIRYASTQFKIDYLPRTEVKPASIAMFGQPVTCLLLYDSGQEGTDQVKEQFDQILLDMKVGTQAVDVRTTALTSLPEFSQYQTVVVLMSPGQAPHRPDELGAERRKCALRHDTGQNDIFRCNFTKAGCPVLCMGV